MLKYCLEKWNKYKSELEKDLKEDAHLNSCDYLYLVQKVTSIILNGGEEEEGKTWNANSITVVNDGDYQGTLLFLIPKKTYQPAAYEYLMTYVEYGSCSICDILESIQDYGNKKPTEQQVKDYMMLCKDLVCSITKPYNGGWKEEKEFEPVEYNISEEYS